MGLLSHIQEEAYDKVSSEFSFFDFISNSPFPRCIILKKDNTAYCAGFSYNLDADSIFRSVSTEDFWNGLVQENDKWLIFNKKNSISDLYQFFSKEIKDLISEIYIYKDSATGNIFLLIYSENEERINIQNNNEFIENLKKCLEYNPKISNQKKTSLSFESFIYHFDFKNAINKEINAQCPDGNLKLLSKTIFNEIFFKAYRLFPKPHIITVDTSLLTLKFEIFAKERIPLVLVQNQFETALENLINREFLQDIKAE